MLIDVDKLRKDLKEELMGAAFGGGFGGALIATFDIDKMSDEEIIEYALKNHMDLSKYSKNYY